MDFARLMKEMRDDEDKDTRLPEAVIADLKEVFNEYQKFLMACAFKEGDIVTPKVGYAIKGAGQPHIVLEVRDEDTCAPEPTFSGEGGSNRYGRRLDMRVGSFAGDQRTAHWVESFEFELYIDAETRKHAGTLAALEAA